MPCAASSCGWPAGVSPLCSHRETARRALSPSIAGPNATDSRGAHAGCVRDMCAYTRASPSRKSMESANRDTDPISSATVNSTPK
jgi:hypothetical protein